MEKDRRAREGKQGRERAEADLGEGPGPF